MRRPGRNELCPCGSGLKYKHCCAGRSLAPERRGWVIGVALFGAVLAGGLVWAVLETIQQRQYGTPNRVWSPEHKHWHTVEGGEPGAAPPGPAPPGKVWSPEHGHWHDAP